MKSITLAAAMAVSTFFYAQEVKTSEENVSFGNGSHNAIVVTIPYANKEIVEKELKSEMKDWGGKFNSSKGEMLTTGSSSKAMGDKPYDGYARILSESGDAIKVAFAVDLGGAYLTSKDHKAQYNTIHDRVKNFGAKAAHASVDVELAAEAKVLKTMESDKADFEKEIADAKKDIEDYKKRIADAEQKIKDNETAVTKKSDEISTQTSKIDTVEKKKKAIKG